MIEMFCGCPTPRRVNESGIGRLHHCDACGKDVRFVSAERLADGGGGGDFDAALTVIAGPYRVGERLQLGGILDIELGKAPERHVCLNSPKVSRAHAKLVRLDYGPSRWKVVDTRSTNGLFVNDERVAERHLKDGDVVAVGDYRLQYGHVVAIDAGAPPALCPSCAMPVAKKAKICVDCGIQVPSGRPVLTRQGVDEDALYAGAESWIRFISLLVWVTPFPIPIRSEAFGVTKPYAMWTIAVATILASITFFIAQRTDDHYRPGAFSQTGINLMLWSPTPADPATAISADAIHRIAGKLDAAGRAELRADYAKRGERVSDDELVSRAVAKVVADRQATRGEFHWYQLLTHAFLHDTSSVYNFAMHLGGNLVFMLCFGTRVNALLGNLMTAILYPVLAVCASGVFLLAEAHNVSGPMVGASGAIMGLAGMYLILFPVHRVFCAMWVRLWLTILVRVKRVKIFSLRGFWILLIYFAYDVVMNLINSRTGVHGGVAHWAHIGGFCTGAVLGLAVLLSRQFDTHGGDVLSVMLGRHAWAIIGKPSRRRRPSAPDPLPAMPAYA